MLVYEFGLIYFGRNYFAAQIFPFPCLDFIADVKFDGRLLKNMQYKAHRNEQLKANATRNSILSRTDQT